MDKKVVLAVAGSGKTSYIVAALPATSRALVLTYTENNMKNLRSKILERFGSIPRNITLNSYFTFLHSFCYRPFLWRERRTKGYNWNMPPEWTRRIPRTNPDFYIDSRRRLYHNRLAKLLKTTNIIPLVLTRIEKYFDCLFIDEIQDLAGHDFNFLAAVASAGLDMLFVGDFYQHTFDTIRDGNVNNNLHEDYGRYKHKLRGIGLTVDETSLQNSYRCSPEICSFVTNQLGIEMHSHRTDSSSVNVVNDTALAMRVMEDSQTVKLFYKEHYKYGCFSRNWGDSKGEDHYGDVCVVLNKTTSDHLRNGCLSEIAAQSKNKLYVACTRARGNLHLLPETLLPGS